MSESTGVRKVEAPWTEDQVASLNGYQGSGVFHELTGEGGVTLVATREGWRERADGPVVQTWAHAPMADWRWRDYRWRD